MVADSLIHDALAVYQSLVREEEKLVLVESCTAGLVSAFLGRFPGISTVLCGSAVVYQTPTKSDWLGIDSILLADPQIGPVSEQVTRELAIAGLHETRAATLCAAVTGHLGPTDDSKLDGCVYVVLARRIAREIEIVDVLATRLKEPGPASSQDYDRRYKRQCEATQIVYRQLLKQLSPSSDAEHDTV